MNPKQIILIMLLLQSLSCSRSYMVKTDSNTIAVEAVNVMAIAYRRPDFAPSDHDDFTNKEHPFFCTSSTELWKDALQNAENILKCLNSIEDEKAIYYYIPDIQPYLELDTEEVKNPACLKTTLAKIPLPREIYYLGRQQNENLKGTQECFSSSFSTKTNQLMMSPSGWLKKKIEIPFPLDRKLKNAQDLSMWLIVTTFTILRSDDKADGKLWASPVPESICSACFKSDALFKDKRSGKIKPVFWP